MEVTLESSPSQGAWASHPSNLSRTSKNIFVCDRVMHILFYIHMTGLGGLRSRSEDMDADRPSEQL